jgi:glyoxylase-like metal-dependent hydrolase (beta-lactamase superfamily II)
MNSFDIIIEGKPNGDGYILRYRTSKGMDVFCLGVPLFYSQGGDWDLGPTWCYAVPDDGLTLIDTGQFGKFDVLQSMLGQARLDIRQVKRVIITHGHEDHDGNIPEVVEASGADIWAHSCYTSMISYHPDIDDGARHPEFPASCRNCLLPDSFNQACLSYHRKRSGMGVSYAACAGGNLDGRGEFQFVATPGHSPDALCTIYQNELFFSGDTILASITPHPSLVLEYYCNQRILPGSRDGQNSSYGLAVYLNSLDLVARKYSHAELLLPGHRLVEKGNINYLNPAGRARDIMRFHLERCGNILRILGDRVMDLEQISIELFDPRLRKGFGRFLSQREVMSHIELLAQQGDVEWADSQAFASRATGSENYREFFSKLI